MCVCVCISVCYEISCVQVFDDLQLEAYDLNVDNLDVHAVRTVHTCASY